MRRVVLVLVGFLSAAPAFAHDAYLCISESASGIAFDKATKKWSQSSFKTGVLNSVMV
jgi:hypothetical protein